MARMSNSPDRHDALTEPLLGEPRPMASSGARDIADPDAAVVAYAHHERYEERASLGQGGMGDVRLCRDRAIGREVAIKTVRPLHASHGALRERFIREARVQAQLEHPAIVPVYDFGVDAQGAAYFTMKRVRGITLEEIVDGIRRGDPEVLRHYGRHRILAAFVQVCRAIDYAHERGVLHRDLKPANVMLGPYGEVYVLDWGLSKVRSASRDLDAALVADKNEAIDVPEGETAAGAVFGTPAYMAPEQVRGEALDERADVYSLGAILFELLTLEPLHGTGNAGAIMARAAAGVDARPTARAPGRAIPPELEVCCVHACALARVHRFASARELAEAVEAYLSGDRDLELRRELAAVHLARARESASRALVPGAPAEERRAALAEAGRAVALSPDDDAPRAVLVDLLTRPPKRPPAEVLAAIDAESSESHMRMLPRASLMLGLPWLLVLPVVAMIGIRDARLLALGAFLGIAPALYSWRAHVVGHSSRGGQAAFALFMAVAVATTSVFYGPLIVAPALAATVGIGMVLHQRVENERLVTVSLALAVLVPAVLAVLDVHPVRFVEASGGALAMLPGAIALPRPLTLLAATAVHLMIVLGGIRYAVTFRRTMSDLALANRLQTWQLEQLVPRDAAIAMSTRRPQPLGP
jgi:serine/threonine-protein kinase